MKCPYCNEEVVVDDIIDRNRYDDSTTEKLIGYCNGCDTHYIWIETYAMKLIDTKIIQAEKG